MATHQYLIIGGSTKCGTTSVFNYFEYHPQICPCVMKESRFFWNHDYPLSEKGRQSFTTKKFDELFRNCSPQQTRLEATPDYLYSIAAAQNIRKELEQCKLVFILREPVSRLISWYNFAMVNGLLSPQTTLQNYIDQQKNSSDPNAPQHLRSLVQSNYSEHIENYIKLFGRQNIHISYYEQLEVDPEKFCGEIAKFAGLAENYFAGYDFKVYNKTISAKSVGMHLLFRKFKRTIRPFTRLLHASIRKKLKLAGHKLEASYQEVNKSASAPIVISPELQQYLQNYYREDRYKLQQLTGQQPPW
ncbi:MAG: sulfotransferase domain-containing protein [Bacteroidota bacterium]|nr:sulfotransferase domain-containing protein [Bacteroidota bacterium]